MSGPSPFFQRLTSMITRCQIYHGCLWKNNLKTILKLYHVDNGIKIAIILTRIQGQKMKIWTF